MGYMRDTAIAARDVGLMMTDIVGDIIQSWGCYEAVEATASLGIADEDTETIEEIAGDPAVADLGIDDVDIEDALMAECRARVQAQS